MEREVASWKERLAVEEDGHGGAVPLALLPLVLQQPFGVHLGIERHGQTFEHSVDRKILRTHMADGAATGTNSDEIIRVLHLN